MAQNYHEYKEGEYEPGMMGIKRVYRRKLNNPELPKKEPIDSVKKSKQVILDKLYGKKPSEPGMQAKNPWNKRRAKASKKNDNKWPQSGPTV